MEDVIIYEGCRFSEDTGSIEGLSDTLIQKIRDDIIEPGVVVLKSVFEKNHILKLRRQILDVMRRSSSSNPDFRENCPNFYRRDINPEKSAVKRVNHFITSFFWNPDFFGEKRFYQAMTRLRNKIAKLPENFTIQGFEPDGYVTYPGITHYPSGGGGLNKHVDPPNKQYCTVMAAMSEKGTDFNFGGLYVEKPDRIVELDDFLQIGDVYLMNPAAIHGVAPIDPAPGTEPEWDSERGRWILFPALIEAKTARGEKVAGLKDLGK